MRKVALVTLGCARNEVDSEEIAARLAADGWELVADAKEAEIALVNTCGFVESAKKDSVDALLEAASLKGGGKTRAVVAIGCMAERYGAELATALPEADAILGFDEYSQISDRLTRILDGEKIESHTPRDRRLMLPIAPIDRAGSYTGAPRYRLTTGPVASIKIANGCDRRCSFCAIPAFRGAFSSRRPTEIIDEAKWLAGEGVREIVLVSENSTSYGKDLGDIRLLEALLPALADVDGLERIRIAYLQPAEMRPSLIQVMTSTPKVAPYFDLSFQHASGAVLRRMQRFGDAQRFLELLETIREKAPLAGVRSNVIVGFPGETQEDFETLLQFLTDARLDAVGVFGYSDEEGTAAVNFDDKLDEDEIRERVEEASRLVEELTDQRAHERIGETVVLLVEEVNDDGIEGRGLHQGPEVDGSIYIPSATARIGDLVAAEVVENSGVDLIAVITS
ncbi:ribosomal protein S12 methylthiotransferase RimO [mine drainage metagenome]|uniref:Ribosomal protein S12 methylthiotransferase RimO n=1 Tax=mine drainage metagenome TaxID=410659 RepID=A0A1J5QI38_9ZZZZ